MVSDTQTDKGFSRPVERGFQRTRNSLHELNSCNINEKVGCAFCCLVAMSNIIVRRVIASSRLLKHRFPLDIVLICPSFVIFIYHAS